MTDFSPATVLVSAGVSVVTGYVGTLLNFRRQRDRARRTYGLAILSEIKSIQRILRQYHGQLGACKADGAAYPALPLSQADMNVFGFNSGNIGLFSIRTAVEVIEFYSRVRALTAQTAAIAARADTGTEAYATALAEHLRAVTVARQHGRAVGILMRRELPVLLEERLRFVRRRARIGERRLSRRWLRVRAGLGRREAA